MRTSTRKQLQHIADGHESHAIRAAETLGNGYNYELANYYIESNELHNYYKELLRRGYEWFVFLKTGIDPNVSGIKVSIESEFDDLNIPCDEKEIIRAIDSAYTHSPQPYIYTGKIQFYRHRVLDLISGSLELAQWVQDKIAANHKKEIDDDIDKNRTGGHTTIVTESNL